MSQVVCRLALFNPNTDDRDTNETNDFSEADTLKPSFSVKLMTPMKPSILTKLSIESSYANGIRQ